MSTEAVAHAKAHRHRIVLAAHLRDAMHIVHPTEPAFLQILNSRAARVIANVLSSMYFFWFCVALDLAELPAVIQSGSVVIWVGYASQTVIQLLALPALGAYAKLNQELQDRKSQTQGETLDAIHTVVVAVHDLNEKQNAMIARQNELIAAQAAELQRLKSAA